MRYGAVRETIASGDLLAWSHRAGWLSSWYDFKINLVRLFTRSEYSHVGLVWAVGGRVFVIESVTPLVRIVPLSHLLPCYVISGSGLTEAQLNRALGRVGLGRYSQLEALRAYFGRNDPGDDALECAEFVASVLGLDSLATPAAVVQQMLERGGLLYQLDKEVS